MSENGLPIPDHFRTDGVGGVWRVPYGERAAQAEAFVREHDIAPATEDEQRVCLLLVDVQNTFCLPDFELFVAGRSGRGAIEDNLRLCRFIYRNLGRITEITATLDTHTAYQIFHPVFWVNADGEHPAGAQTIIQPEDLEAETWKVNPAVADTLGVEYAWLERHARHYVRSLSGARYPLMVWPYHAMVSGIGHAMVSSVDEAAFFHAIARQSQTRFEIKGGHPFTENYSAFGPEVHDDPNGRVLARQNARLVDRLLGFDALIVAGQAKSHCVAWTLHDLLREIERRDRALAHKIFLLEDCTSPVVVPNGPDFTEPANEAFRRFADAGMHVVTSTAPLEIWEGLAV
jgi:nicotinamidase-related amidase